VSSPAPQRDGKTPSFFVVVPGATGAKQSIFQGKDQIIYHLQSEYPADYALRTISVRLKNWGWEPLQGRLAQSGLAILSC